VPGVQRAAHSVDAHRLSAAEVVAALATDSRRGLSGDDVRSRLERFGRNELASVPTPSAWHRFAAQFKSALVILLLVATAVSVAVWYYERYAPLPYEALAILTVVLLNATMGFIQEARAEAAVSALRAMSADDATVVRDGETKKVPASELVPGDLIVIEEGDTIPADARVVVSISLQTSEAALTGESLPVSKDIDPVGADATISDRTNMVFNGTAATFGRGQAVVTATGMQTEMGRIAGMLRDAPNERTPLQQDLDRTGKLLGMIVVAIAVVMIATIIVTEGIRGVRGFVDVFIFGVALAVAAVPEGLPAIVTVVLALGVRRMAKRNAIVRHLSAVETLGSASVIASDKTGTLTKNEMTVRVVVTASGRVAFTGSGYAPDGEAREEGGGAIDGDLRVELERALGVADLVNNASVREEDAQWKVQGDPTEAALLVAARKAGIALVALEERLPRVGEVPFSSERKLMTTLHRDRDRGEHMVSFTKGAPDVLLARCTRELVGEDNRSLTVDRRREIEGVTESLADDALRTLGVAFRRLATDVPADDLAEIDETLEQDLVFAGLIGMIDPPRDEAKDAVKRARAAGIRPIMITGDHPRTALVIAAELGMTDNHRVVSGSQLEAMSDAELDRIVAEVSVYARVNPEHKLRIVKALQRGGAIVAMTGDGVNDAPALKTADIGVAMGITGTDVSKGAADIVLADDNFASIVAAVEEGRAIFANIRKFLRYLLSSNIGEVLTMFFGVLLADRLGLPTERGTIVLPLLATQILWVNLVTDGPPALALGVDRADAPVMDHAPRPRGERVITSRMWRAILLDGIAIAGSTLFALDASLPGGLIEGGGNLRYAQTMAFTTLVFAQLINVFNARSDERSAFGSLFANGWLWAAIALSVGLQALVVYVPGLQRAFGTADLSGADWARCTLTASAVLWISELSKLWSRRRSRGRA
jgi:P-type Ca2+ transporter type 2C